MLCLYTFGGLRIEHREQLLRLPTRKARHLLAYLVTHRDCPQPRAVLVSALWPDLPEDKARRRLSDTLWRVRHVLGDRVQADEEHVWLDDNLARRSDVAQFCDVVAHLQRERPDMASLEDALALYRGPYLDGLTQDWVLLERERLRGLFLEALGDLLERHKRVGDYPAALHTARRLVTTEPLHEAAHRELMRLYHLLGRDAEAVEQYHRCRELLRETLDVAPAPETEMLYQVLRRRGAPSASTAEVHLPAPARSSLPDLDTPPLVGREVERAALLGHLEAAARGRGELLLLEGEPGIGKSRLIEELAAGAQWRSIDVIRAQAETSTSCAYGPFLEALSGLLTPLRLRQLRQLVDSEVLQAAAPLLPCVETTLEECAPLPELPPPEARNRLQQSLVAIILGFSRIGPRLWVLEDLQRVDAETLALLLLLYPRLVKSRTLLVLTGRHAELRDRPAVWKTLQKLDRTRPFPRYTLRRLDEGTIEALLRHLFDDVPPTLAKRLVQESGGVPLYIVEILKAWRDEGHVAPTEHGRWHWKGEPPGTLPPRLGEEILSHRLTHLSPDAEAVLKSAAVIGTEVDFDLLAEVCTLPDVAIDLSRPERYLRATDELLGLSFLTETQVGYRFSHEQLRRVIDERLTLAERQRLHHRVALALKERRPEAFRLLARHFAAAGLRPPALHYLCKAIERAREIFAYHAARACYDELLTLLSYPEDRTARYDVLRDRIEVLGWIGDREAQGRDLEEMLRLARALSDEARRAAALYRRSEWHRLQGQYEAADKHALAALEIYRRLGDDHARANLLSQLGRNVIYLGDYARAATYFGEALSIYEELADLDGQSGCLIGLAHVAEFEGNFVLNLSYCQQSLTLAQAAGDPHRTSHAFFAVGVTYHDLGDMDAAETHFRKALDLAEATGDRRRQGVSHLYLGVVATERGAFAAAQRHLETARQLLREVQDISWEGDARAALGRLALLQDDPATAKTHLNLAYRRCLNMGEHNYAVIHLSYLALAELALGDESAAWQHSRKAVTELEADLMRVEHPQRIYYNHLRVSRATRHWAAARTALTEAKRIVDTRAARIDDADLRTSYRTGLRVNRAILKAVAEQPPPGQLRVRLARVEVPAHRRPEPGERVAVTWTLNAGEEDAALAEQEGKVALRRHRILRLLSEAEAAGALPNVADLASVLDVSTRTIRSDLAALRAQGHPARTRGSRP